LQEFAELICFESSTRWVVRFVDISFMMATLLV